MRLQDAQFLARINAVAKETGGPLPQLADSPGAADEVAAWASFLEACVRRGIELGDPRWRALTVVRTSPVTTFALASGREEPTDSDFRLGLQLLIGMMDDKEA